MQPNDCWSKQPRVRHDNRVAWFLYGIFDTQWDGGFSGYRLRYIYDPLMAMARELGYREERLLDIVERVKVIESAVREIEGLRAEQDRKEQERKAKGGNSEALIGRG